MKCKLKKGDIVEVTNGKDRGKKGKILKVFRDANRAIVENINLIEKKQKPTQDNPKGGIIKIEETIPVASIQIVCSSCNKRTRVGMKMMENKQKLRFCRKCNESLDKK
jgi:large subunit ribosomal protein L24